MHRRILVTGGTGYLGRNIIDALLEVEIEVSVLVREHSNLEVFGDKKSSLRFVLNDDLGPSDKFDAFIHMATAYGRKGESREEIFETNKHWPLRLIQKIRHPELVILNTDTSLPETLNDYAASKSEFLNELKKLESLNFYNLICEQFYGPEDGTFVSFLKRELSEGSSIDMTPGTQKRDFIFISEVVSAYMRVLALSAQQRSSGPHEFEVGSGTSYTIKDIAMKVCSILGKDQTLLKWGAKPFREGEVMDSYADTTALKSIGWELKVNLESGLKLALGK